MSKFKEYIIELDKDDIIETIDISQYKGTDFTNTESTPYDQLYEYIFNKEGKEKFKNYTVSNFCVSKFLGELLRSDLEKWVNGHTKAWKSNNEVEIAMLYLDRSTVTVYFDGIAKDKLYIRK